MEDKANLYQRIPHELGHELTEDLLRRENVRIERIVSHGHSSPPDFWCDQNENEWVILLAGAARLRFERGGEVIELSPGDYLNIPAGARHRVDWTEPEQDTIWLAVFY